MSYVTTWQLSDQQHMNSPADALMHETLHSGGRAGCRLTGGRVVETTVRPGLARRSKAVTLSAAVYLDSPQG